MKFIEVIFIVAAALTGTCRSQPSDPTNRLMMTKNQMDFTMTLFKHSSIANESHLLSPFAIISRLSALYQGARGDTQHEMTVLGGGQSAQIFDNYAHSIINLSDIDDGGSSQENEDFIIGESAKLWVHQNVSINPDFIRNMIIYGVTVEDEHFSKDQDDQLVETASEWLYDTAYERANNIMFMNFDFSLFLINELHLKLEWKYHFVSLNYQTYFSLSLSRKINIPMMGRTAEFPYYEDQSVQVISLPLVKPGMCMIIILPKQICELAKIEMELTGEKLFNYISALEESDKSKKTMVTIPKFYARKYFILSDGLESMGLRSMFTQSANFTGISDQPLSITKHIGNLASMQITEDGINVNCTDDDDNASTSTDKSDMINTLFIPSPQIFDANHPFIYFITDKLKNILWIGRYMGDEDAVEADDEMIKEYEKIMETDEITGYDDELEEFEKIMEKTAAERSNERIKSSEYGEFSGMTRRQEQGEFSGMTQSSEYGEFSGMIQPLNQGQYVEVMQPPEQGEYIEYPDEDEFANADSQNLMEIDFQNM